MISETPNQAEGICFSKSAAFLCVCVREGGGWGRCVCTRTCTCTCRYTFKGWDHRRRWPLSWWPFCFLWTFIVVHVYMYMYVHPCGGGVAYSTEIRLPCQFILRCSLYANIIIPVSIPAFTIVYMCMCANDSVHVHVYWLSCLGIYVLVMWSYLSSALTPEQREYQELARKFSREVILPQAAKYDQSGEVHVHAL